MSVFRVPLVSLSLKQTGGTGCSPLQVSAAWQEVLASIKRRLGSHRVCLEIGHALPKSRLTFGFP